MIYAPIIIPTCNRIDHLKRCIESLEMNSLAQKTNIYISIDYPPNDKYVDGYKSVVNYLNKGINGFKEVYIFKQQRNLGPYNNIEFLINTVKNNNDFWILTEDDNEFSPNFLEYMNKCLLEFKDNKEIFAICGSLETKTIESKNTVYLSSYFQPYGCAFWKNKYEEFIYYKEEMILSKDKQELLVLMNLYKDNIWNFRTYVNKIMWKHNEVFWNFETQKLNVVDGVIQLYLYFSGLKCIFPVKAKSRTWGNDGTGFNMKRDDKIDPVLLWPLDNNNSFNVILSDVNEGIKYFEENAIKYKKTHVHEILKLWIKVVVKKIGINKL